MQIQKKLWTHYGNAFSPLQSRPPVFFPPKKDLEQNRVYHEVTWSLNQNRPLSQRGVELRH